MPDDPEDSDKEAQLVVVPTDESKESVAKGSTAVGDATGTVTKPRSKAKSRTAHGAGVKLRVAEESRSKLLNKFQKLNSAGKVASRMKSSDSEGIDPVAEGGSGSGVVSSGGEFNHSMAHQVQIGTRCVLEKLKPKQLILYDTNGNNITGVDWSAASP